MVAGWQPTITTRPTSPPRLASVAKTMAGFIVVGVDRGGNIVADAEISDVGLDNGDRARRLPERHGVDQHEGVVAVEQFVGEVDAPDAVVDDAHSVGHGSAGQRLATSTPKPSSPRKMLPMPATRIRAHRSASTPVSTSISSGWKYR